MSKMNMAKRYMLMNNVSDRRRETEDRFRDGRGREHYDNGRYAPMRNEYDNRHRSEHDDGILYDDRRGERERTSHYPGYEMRRENGTRSRKGNNYRMEDDDRSNPARMIGFSGEITRGGSDYDEYGNYLSDDSISYMPMTRERVDEWMREIQNEDGTTGAHWNFDQASNVMKQKGYKVDPVEFYATINMMYSDYCKVAKKLNINTVDFYGCMADAFLNDKDAVPNKLAAYYSCIVD